MSTDSNPDWRDGFLFVGNHLSLDFLNTRPRVDGSDVELLPDSPALLRWARAAGLVSPRDAAQLSKSWDPGEDIDALRQFREEYRKVVQELERGCAVPAAFIRGLNQLLAAHPFTDKLIAGEDGLRRQRLFDYRSPEDVFAPLVDDIAQFLTTLDQCRLRQCAGCVLHYYDTSKKGTRRWCSMRLCGNRCKVAAYAKRNRA